MNYVRTFSSTLSDAWNSINPATLSGAIDVIVVEQDDGTLACSPFHVRFGKFQLLRPSQKKVEFKVNDVKQDLPMKLGEGGEAFFVFGTTENIPAALQTSPPVSPEVSPRPLPAEAIPSIDLPEPEPLDLATEGGRARSSTANGVISSLGLETRADDTPRVRSPLLNTQRPVSGDWSGQSRLPVDFARSSTADTFPLTKEAKAHRFQSEPPEQHLPLDGHESRSHSPPPVSLDAAVTRAISLSKKLWSSNIPTRITETGDLMLDMTGYKSADEEALKAELVARKILTQELEGNYDIGSLIGEDEHGNLWIYSSVEAKEAADRKAAQATGLLPALNPAAMRSADAVSDPGYHSDDAPSDSEALASKKHGVQTRRDSDSALGLSTAPGSPEAPPGAPSEAEASISYAKTLRLTSDQLKALNLKSGQNTMSFFVNKATCSASIYFWHHDAHIVISDIDGTITKSDAMGHLMNMVGRDWTHAGVAKLYTDIAQNGYHILYLTSRSVGQADTTRNYLWGIVQEGYRLPKGPVILSPDRTMAALKREVYLRRPEVFKMACLRDIMNLFNPVPANETSPGGADSAQQQPAKPSRTPFYAGFGNRLNDALSYRSVSIPPTRIFTINSNAEVSLHLLTLNKYRTSYVSMREIVDHYFPPTSLLIKEGGEEYTDFNYWREPTLDVDEFSASESEESDDEEEEGWRGRPSVDESIRSEDVGDDEDEEEGEVPAEMEDSYYSRGSMDSSGYAEGSLENSFMESVDGEEGGVSGLDGATPVADTDTGTAVDEEGLNEAMRDMTIGSMADKTPVARPKVVSDELGELRPLTSPPASPRR